MSLEKKGEGDLDTETQTEKKVICNGGREWSDGVTSQGTRRTDRNQQKLEETKKDSSLEPSDSMAC